MEVVGETYLRIGELSRRAGVSPDLLRAWERRYALLEPSRSAGGFRLYSDRDLERVRTMLEHLANGLSAAEAARLTLEGASPRSRTEDLAPSSADSSHELMRAIEEYDDARAQAAIDRLSAALGPDGLVTLMHEFVRELHGSKSTPRGTMHFGATVVRGRLLGLARGWDRGFGPRAVLAGAPGESDDLDLVALGLLLRSHGWRITLLGAPVEVPALEEACETLAPASVVVASQRAESLVAIREPLTALGVRFALALAGMGATSELADDIGGQLLDPDPSTAAEQLSSTSVLTS